MAYKNPEDRKNWVSNNRDRVRANYQRWVSNNPEKNKIMRDGINKRRKDKLGPYGRKLSELKRVYGLSGEDYQNLVDRSMGRCAICGNFFEPERRSEPCIDHDHVTGEVRGLLCVYCNRGLGQFRDDPFILKNAIVYLQK